MMPSVRGSRPAQRFVACTTTSKDPFAAAGASMEMGAAGGGTPKVASTAALRRMSLIVIHPLLLNESFVVVQPDAVVVGRDDAVAIVVHAAVHLRSGFPVVGHQDVAVGEIHHAVIVQIARERIEIGRAS